MTALLNNLTDLTVQANTEEAWRELRLCATDADYAAWGRTFGEPALLAIDDMRPAYAGGWED